MVIYPMVFSVVMVIAICVILVTAIFRWEPNFFMFRLIEKVFGTRYSCKDRVEKASERRSDI
jgi:hypothetical protein